MNDNVESLVLEQLRLIREGLAQVRGEMSDFRKEVDGRFDDLDGRVVANTTVVMALAQYIGAMNERVPPIEDHLGIAR